MAVETSNPDIHVTGPQHLFVRTPANTWDSPAVSAKIWYLGTTKVQPQIKHEKAWLPVHNSIAGPLVPFTYLYQGERGQLGFLLNRFSNAGYVALRNAGGPSGNTANSAGVGYESSYARGGAGPGRMSFELWILWEFGFGAAVPGSAGPNTTVGLPRGRYYPSVMLGPHEIAQSGTPEEALLLVLNAHSLYLGTAFSAPDARRRGFTLYSESESDFPADVVIGNVQ
jgi:hypothetical protein